MHLGRERWYSVLKWLTYLLGFIYILNSFSPLRLHVDTLRYFAILDCIENGCHPESVAAKDYLPYGYTALLLAFSKAGILKSITIVLINCVFLFASIAILIRLFKLKERPWLFIVLILLNWTIIKFVLHPLSEMQYLLLSVMSLYYFNHFTQERKIHQLALAFLFAGVAFITRTVGITLIAALTLGLLWEFRQQLILLISKNRIIVIGSLLVIIAVLSFSRQLGLLHYTDVLIKQFTEGVQYTDLLRWHFIELSEIGLNLPFTKVVDFMPSVIRPLFLLGGIVVIICVFFIVLWNRTKVPVSVILYLGLYFVLMFNWPFYDPRFWVPILPICIGVLQKSTFDATGLKKFGLYFLGLTYGILGVASIAYFTYTSFDVNALAKTQASGVYKNEYEAVYLKEPTLKYDNPDSVIVNLLERCK